MQHLQHLQRSRARARRSLINRAAHFFRYLLYARDGVASVAALQIAISDAISVRYACNTPIKPPLQPLRTPTRPRTFCLLLNGIGARDSLKPTPSRLLRGVGVVGRARFFWITSA